MICFLKLESFFFPNFFCCNACLFRWNIVGFAAARIRNMTVFVREGIECVIFVFFTILRVVEIGDIILFSFFQCASPSKNSHTGHRNRTVNIKERLCIGQNALHKIIQRPEVSASVSGFCSKVSKCVPSWFVGLYAFCRGNM